MSAQPHHDGFLQALESVVILVILALYAVTFVVQPSRIPSKSMQPTLDVGDFLLIDKQAFTPTTGLGWALPATTVHRGDIAICRFPVDPAIHIVKRIVALPGDRLHLRDGHLFVNGVAVREPYASFTPSVADAFRDDFPTLTRVDPEVEPAWWAQLRASTRNGEIVVPAGMFFVLGDNRNDSLDSRYWGFVPAANLEGRPFLVDLTLPPAGLPLREKLRAVARSIRVVR